jgi:hypothetical protein
MNTTHKVKAKLARRLSISPAERIIHQFNRQQRSQRTRAARLATIEGRAHRLWYDAKTRAAKEAVAFSISEEWIRERLRAGKCEMTDIQFELGRSIHRVHKYAPSLDRIDPRKGYVESNVRLVIWMYNHSRSEYSDSDLLDFAFLLLRKQLQDGNY